jgi:hypothetical protein
VVGGSNLFLVPWVLESTIYHIFQKIAKAKGKHDYIKKLG